MTDAAGEAHFSNVMLVAFPDSATITGCARNHSPVSVQLYVANLGVEEEGGREPSTYLATPTPNPAVSSVDLQWSAASGQASIQLHDISGRLVNTVASGLPAGGGSLTIALEDASGSPLPSGVYLLRLTDGSESTTRRLVILR
jgi:hypothetical protein